MGEISSPEAITSTHLLQHFVSGELELDNWLRQRALKNHQSGASKTFVVHRDYQVLGYYCLAAGSVVAAAAPGRIKRNMPNPIPVMVLGRLAVDKHSQGLGIGRGLLKDAVLRTMTVAKQAGIRALLVHAISDSAKYFYKRFGFIESPLEPMTLMLPLQNLTA